MYIKNLSLYYFRNIEKINLDFCSGLNVFFGNNAQGKTNIIEAIYILGHFKSFRISNNKDLVKNNFRESKIFGEIKYKNIKNSLEMIISDTGKKIRLNGKEPGSINEIVEFLRPVLFSPEEVNLLKGGPAGRRALLDRAIFQTDPSYLGRIRDYNRSLLQRNTLLRRGSGSDEVLPWTEALIKKGSRIRYDRHRFLQTLIPLFREIFTNISGVEEKGDLNYLPGGENEEELQENLRRELKRCEATEYRLGQSLAGPQRDDLHFLVDGRPVRIFGSQGQQRTAMLAFKTAQVLTLEKMTGESPLLLLDDMTSELDRKRQGYFFRFLMERPGQVFITTTDLEDLIRVGIKECRYFRVEAGAVEEIHPEKRVT